jgi:ribosomal protein S18 acetylase RimI-like enzyme
MLATMEGYLLDGIDVNPEQGTLLIAERSDGTRLGAVSVSHHQNFTGEQQAYIGELAVIEEEEGHRIGHILADAAEEWARERGHTLLVLDTGAANTRARRFYTNLGYREESVRLVKLLDTASV